jgi:[NiFe] hydrogenase diaphorase moiety large subunit
MAKLDLKNGKYIQLFHFFCYFYNRNNSAFCFGSQKFLPLILQSMNLNTIDVLQRYNNEKARLMDILIDIQSSAGYVSHESIKLISERCNISEVDVEQTLSFYHFLSEKPLGKYRIYLNDSVVANMMGRSTIAKAFEKEVGCQFGFMSSDGLIGLYDTACIGMNDQEPAAIINDTVFTNLTPFRVKEIVRDIKTGKDVKEMFVESYGDSSNSHELIKAMVFNNIRKKGAVIFSPYHEGEALEKIISMTPNEVIEIIKSSNLRGRGGAGFPTGLKWEFCKRSGGQNRYIFCNADEGEPGTFKDRVILTELPQLIFEGMVCAGYAVESTQGILYIRYEYRYLRPYLENILEEMRTMHFLGKNIMGKQGFDFDIRIQSGAGAYVCGEESALIESAEGKRGEPRDRPPFPVEKGYLEMPTVVNNVETLCSVVKILVHSVDWYKSLGTRDSTGTKVLSVAGDCRYPGVYEVEWGFNVNDILEMVGAVDVQAVQIGGPSGSLLAPEEFNRILCYSDLSTGGSIIVFNNNRDLLKDVVLNFTSFFIEESCGSCVPCRTLTLMYKEKLNKILSGHGVLQDLEDMLAWGPIMKLNRCGLGQAAANPILTSLRNFKLLYLNRLKKGQDFDTVFDIQAAVADSCIAAHRYPIFNTVSHE